MPEKLLLGIKVGDILETSLYTRHFPLGRTIIKAINALDMNNPDLDRRRKVFLECADPDCDCLRNGWNVYEEYFTVVTPVCLTDDELARSVPIPDISELGKFLQL